MSRHLLPVLVLPLLLLGCAPGKGQEATSAASTPGQAAGCSYPAAGSPAKPVDPPSGDSVMRSGTARVTLTLDGEPVELTLDRGQAPCTTHSFESLASQGWYTNTRCHRLVDQGIFVLQCGDPSGTGRGGPGYSFADELVGTRPFTAAEGGQGEGAVVYPRGTVAMANAGPGTNGSQFFLVWQDSPLPPAYSVFGTMDDASVTRVAAVAAQGVAADGMTPNAPAMISDVTLG